MEAVKNKTEEELDEDVKMESEEVPVNIRHLIRVYEGIHLNKCFLEYILFLNK